MRFSGLLMGVGGGGGGGSELLEGHTTEYEPSLVGLPDRSHRHRSPS